MHSVDSLSGLSQRAYLVGRLDDAEVPHHSAREHLMNTRHCFAEAKHLGGRHRVGDADHARTSDKT